jgi:plasmid replication initiation protein
MPKTTEPSRPETGGGKGRGGGSPTDQLDLFVALPGDLPTHDQQEMMERPFFSLSKGKRTEPIDYRVTNGTTEIRVKVTANAETGMATIWDADILIWAASQIREAMAKGIPTSRKFRASRTD